MHPEALADRLTLAGCEVTSLHSVDGDWLFEAEVTPNRPDLLSHLGLARETAAVLGRTFHLPRWLKRELEPLLGEPTPLPIAIEDPEGCRRYVGIVIEGVQVRPSPPGISRRLEKLGIRPVNNIVDETNRCLLEMGQPLHAFDLDAVEGESIRVRQANPKESLVTIDGVSRPLTPELLVIADARRPLALAGIMGGRDSEIRPTTRRILLESAWFNPMHIRRGTRHMRLSSESSYRFERGVDPVLVPMAAIRAARQIVSLAGGRIVGSPADVGEKHIPHRRIPLRPAKAQNLLGMHIYPAQQRRLLERLGCEVSGTVKGFRVEPPSWRADLQNPEDLYEELARLWGYERCPVTLPPVGRQAVHSDWQPLEDSWIARESQIRQLLVAAGMQEILTYSLVHPEDHAKINRSTTGALELENPLSRDYSVLRTTLLIGALQTVARNLHRKRAGSFQLFELGRVYREKTVGKEFIQPKALGLLVAGTPAPAWGNPSRPLDLFDLKGILHLLWERLGIRPSESVEPNHGLHYLDGPALLFRVGENLLGAAGCVSPEVLARYEIPEEIHVSYAELDLDIFAGAQAASLKVETLPKVPPVVRDLAILLSEEVSHQEVYQSIQAAGKPLLESALLFDLYKGKQVPAGKKGLAFRLAYSAGDRTLTDEEIAAAHQRIAQKLQADFQAILR